MKFDDIFRKFWDSKPNTIFFNIFQGLIRKKNEIFYIYYNSDLLKNKRPASKVDSEKKIVPVEQNFQEQNFSFQKIDLNEIIFAFKHESQLAYENDIDLTNFHQFDHLIIINKSPICQYHSLIIPFVHDKLPQRMDSDALHITLKLMNLMKNSNRNLRFGFNSLGGFSSVNNLHFHSVFADDLFIDDKIFPIEKAQSIMFRIINLLIPFEKNENLKITINIIEEYPIKCLKIQAENGIPEENITNIMADVIGIILNFLTEQNIAYNMMIANMGRTFYLIPRNNQGLNERKHDFNCAWLELCGLVICRNEQIFLDLTIEDYTMFLKENLQIDDKQFGNWLEYINQVF